MSTITQIVKQLLQDRAVYVRKIKNIDVDLARAQSTVTQAVSQLSPVPPAPGSTAIGGTMPAPAPVTHDRSRRRAALAIRFQQEITSVLVFGALSAHFIAKRTNLARDDIKASLKRLHAIGIVKKNGNRGPRVTWELATQKPAAPAPTAVREEFETVFPHKGDPKLPPAEALKRVNL